MIRGGNCIIGPLGPVLAGPVFGEEAVLTADLDPGDIPRARFDFESAGRYARPDVFKLLVDEAPKSAVEFGERNLGGTAAEGSPDPHPPE